MVESTEAALNQRMTNLDKRLTAEIAFAAGMTAGLQDFLQDFACYEKNTTPLFPYPRDMGWAFGFLNYSAMVAALAEAEGVYLRTIDEGAGIPTKEAHAVSYRSAKWIFDVVRQQKIVFQLDEVRREERMAEIEVRALLDKILEVGDGDVAVGLQKAFDLGYMDTPLSSNIHVQGKAMGARDAMGACRYLDFGNLPLPEEAKEYNREKIAEREKALGKKLDYHTVVEEFWTFSKGRLVGA